MGAGGACLGHGARQVGGGVGRLRRLRCGVRPVGGLGFDACGGGWGLRSCACGAGFCAVGVAVAPTAGGWCGAAVGAVVLGLARECVLERFGARTRQPLRAPTPTPSPSRRGRLPRHRWRRPPSAGARRLLRSGGVRRIANRARVAGAATLANRGRAAGGVRECRQPRARAARTCRQLRAFVSPPVPQGPGRCPQGDGGTFRSWGSPARAESRVGEKPRVGVGGRGGTSLAPRCANTPRPTPTPGLIGVHPRRRHPRPRKRRAAGRWVTDAPAPG